MNFGVIVLQEKKRIDISQIFDDIILSSGGLALLACDVIDVLSS